MTPPTVAVIGAGPVGRALERGLQASGTSTVVGVRDPGDGRHDVVGPIDTLAGAVAAADVVLLAVPAQAVPDVVPALGLRAGQVVVDATNAVFNPVPGGLATMGDVVASLLPEGVLLVKAFNTIGAEHLGDGRFGGQRAFLPIAGDPAGVDVVLPLAEGLGFEAVPLGGRDRFSLVEDHARLWIHLAFACGWGRQFGFVAVRS